VSRKKPGPTSPKGKASPGLSKGEEKELRRILLQKMSVKK